MPPHQITSPSFKKTGFTEATVIVLLAHFSDKPFDETLDLVEQTLRQNTGKLGLSTKFFADASNDAFNLKFKFVEGFVDVGEDLDYFTGQIRDQGGSAELEFSKLAVDVANAEISTMVQEGLADQSLPYSFLIIHSAADSTDTDGLSSLMYEETIGDTTYPYALCSIESLTGTFCHELGHSLFNWPDLYDSGDLDVQGHYTNGVASGLGDWCVMSRGIGQPPEKFTGPSGWIKVCQELLIPTELDPGTHVLQPGAIAKLLIDDDEYLLLENRAKKPLSNDADLPGEGLLIYHIDESVEGFNNFFPNRNELTAGVRLYQGDGFSDLLIGGIGDGTDPYPSFILTDSGQRLLNNSLTDYTTPRIRRNNGLLSGIRIENISQDQSNQISFEFKREAIGHTSRIVQPDGISYDVRNGPGVDAIASVKARRTGLAEDLLVAAELPDQLVAYEFQMNQQNGEVVANVFAATTASLSKDARLKSFTLNNKSYVFVYEPISRKAEVFELHAGGFSNATTILPWELRHRRYMHLAIGEFLVAGELNLVGLDPFKQLLEFYRIENNLQLTW